MEFIKAIVEETDNSGATIISHQGKQFEALLPLSKVEVIIKRNQGYYEVKFPDMFLTNYRIKIITIKTDLKELFQRADKL